MHILSILKLCSNTREMCFCARFNGNIVNKLEMTLHLPALQPLAKMPPAQVQVGIKR